jgi:acetyl-CoA acetyltransferase
MDHDVAEVVRLVSFPELKSAAGARVKAVHLTVIRDHRGPRHFLHAVASRGHSAVEASKRALARAGISFQDLDVIELNEAFAAQVLACLDEINELDEDRVNPNGGGIALGHPLGATGARLVGTLARELKSRGGGLGLATACIGVGQGLAVVLEST